MAIVYLGIDLAKSVFVRHAVVQAASSLSLLRPAALCDRHGPVRGRCMISLDRNSPPRRIFIQSHTC
jgi:hypothetical protein